MTSASYAHTTTMSDNAQWNVGATVNFPLGIGEKARLLCGSCGFAQCASCINGTAPPPA